MKFQSKNTLTHLIFSSIILLSACNSSAEKGSSLADPQHINTPTAVLPEDFSATIDGKKVQLFTLQNANGVEAKITNYGGRLVSLLVPDRNNELTDVVAGFSTLKGYQESTEPYFGATIGRYANRIAKGKFTIDGKSYQLYINNGVNTLHGGKKGFQDVVWDAQKVDEQVLVLNYLSKDMEEGFPGNLKIKVTYRLTDDNAIEITYEATTDKKTVVNLTNHAFFNLNGESSGDILKHQVKIFALKYTPVDSTLIPTGQLAPVKGTPFDFLSARTIGERINDDHEQLKYGKGYDHNFILNSHQADQPVAVVLGDQSGIRMEVFTDQSGLQFYSGNFMEGKNKMKGNHRDEFRTAFCMETQNFPDAPNQPSFPIAVLKPGIPYYSVSIYKFSVKE